MTADGAMTICLAAHLANEVIGIPAVFSICASFNATNNYTYATS